MRQKNIEIVTVVFVAFVLSLLLYVSINQIGYDKETIKSWATENSCEIVNVERTFFDHGPFWFVGEDDRIYKVEVKDRLEHNRVTYFRFGLWKYDQEWSN